MTSSPSPTHRLRLRQALASAWLAAWRLVPGAAPVAALITAGCARLRAAWHAEFALYSALDRDSAEMRARHLQGVQRVLPLLMLANLANALLLYWAFAGVVPVRQRLPWLLMVGLCCAAGLRAWWRRRRGLPPRAGVQAVRRSALGAVVLAALWSWAIATWFAAGGAEQRLMLGALAVGMMCAGAFALATLPQAGIGYVAVLDIGALRAMQEAGGALQRPIEALVLVYGVVLCWSVLNAARSFNARLVSEREAARQGQWVQLLLRDFEEHASSLLWEVGADGCLSHVAPRLAQALGGDAARLHSLSLPQALALRAPAEADVAGRHAAALRSALAQGRAFRDLELPMAIDDELRWWALTAKPLVDEGGRHAGWRGVIADVTAARTAHHQLALLAHYDALTGLANRVQLRERLAEVLERTLAAQAGAAAPVGRADLDPDPQPDSHADSHADNDPGTDPGSSARTTAGTPASTPASLTPDIALGISPKPRPTALPEAHAAAADPAGFGEATMALPGRAGPPPSANRSALVCLDVDHFKAINDTLGHAAGDAVLVAVAKRLRATLRWGDLAARLGGDEFALLIDDVGSDAELHALARRLTGVLNQPCEVNGQQVSLGVSLGLAVVPPQGCTLDEMMAHADLALYAAKEAGRGRYEVFVPRLGDRHRRRIALEHGLRSALRNGQMRLNWQPRIAIADWRVVGAEALLRWHHPELGEVPPQEFIVVAEDCGLIDTIGAWVLAQACKEATALPATLVASVNVSAAQLRRHDFARTVQWALQAAGLAPERLELEITESLFIDDASVALSHLHTLRQAGVRVAMDDFGTGYSSLAYLRRFPFDTLKIDRAFVRELMTRHDARAIVHTIIDLARTLGMHTLAEGVEEPAQLALLHEAGCDAIQGWLVARAMPLRALNQLLANWVPLRPGSAPGGRPAMAMDVQPVAAAPAIRSA